MVVLAADITPCYPLCPLLPCRLIAMLVTACASTSKEAQQQQAPDAAAAFDAAAAQSDTDNTCAKDTYADACEQSYAASSVSSSSCASTPAIQQCFAQRIEMSRWKFIPSTAACSQVTPTARFNQWLADAAQCTVVPSQRDTVSSAARQHGATHQRTIKKPATRCAAASPASAAAAAVTKAPKSRDSSSGPSYTRLTAAFATKVRAT